MTVTQSISIQEQDLQDKSWCYYDMSIFNVEETSWLWHYKFGHLNFKSLNML